jgi:hypothetical protein
MAEPADAKRAGEYAAKLWDLANAITAFAVAQTIATLLFVGEHDQGVQPAVRANLGAVIAIIVVMTIVYAAGTWMCYVFQRRLIGSSDANLNRALAFTASGRVAIIALFGAIMIFFLAAAEPDRRCAAARSGSDPHLLPSGPPCSTS